MNSIIFIFKKYVMELRHLRYFRAVAEEKHITRAAEKLSIQQPPLSLQIKALESELEVKLFDRLPRGVALTEAGRSFYSDTCRLLDGVEEAVARTRRVARGEIGDVAIGFTSSVIFHPAIRKSIQSFRTHFPRVTLSLEENGSTELITDIQENRLDAAFVRTSNSHVPGIAVHKVLEEPMLLALPAGHLLTVEKDRPIRLQQLIHEPLVLYRRSSGPGLYDRIISAFERCDIAPIIIQEAPRIGSALNLVAVGMGACFVPESMSVIHPEGVHYRSIGPQALLSAPIMLACRKSESSEGVRKFVAMARAAAKT